MNYSLIVYNEKKEVTDVISFTSVTQFNESYVSDITENTVEYGFNISDHMTTKSPEFTLDGLVSDYTIQDPDLQLEWNGTDFTTSLEQNGGSNVDLHLRVKESIKSIVLERKVFTLVVNREQIFLGTVSEKSDQMLSSAVDVFTNCLMPNLSFPVKDGVGGAFFFTMTVKQIKVAVTSTSTFDSSSIPLVVPVTAQVTNGTAGQIASGTDANGKDVGDKNSSDSSDDSKKKDLKKLIESSSQKSSVCQILLRQQAIADGMINLGGNYNTGVGRSYTFSIAGNRASYKCN